MLNSIVNVVNQAAKKPMRKRFFLIFSLTLLVASGCSTSRGPTDGSRLEYPVARINPVAVIKG